MECISEQEDPTRNVKYLIGDSDNFNNDLSINTPTCYKCLPGQERNSQNPSVCANCGNGYIRPDNSENGCTNCELGQITNSNEDELRICPSGQVPNNLRNACVTCSGNQFTQQNEDGTV